MADTGSATNTLSPPRLKAVSRIKSTIRAAMCKSRRAPIAFFAAIEQRDDPALRGRPVVVGAQPGGRGVVATCSYEARAFGIRSAMPINEAYRRCPEAVYLRPRMERYRAVARRIREVMATCSPVVIYKRLVDAIDRPYSRFRLAVASGLDGDYPWRPRQHALPSRQCTDVDRRIGWGRTFPKRRRLKA